MTAKRILGKIVSDKMQKTVVIAVESPKKHEIYSKPIKSTRKFKARNEINAKLGDFVCIEECRPYGKDVNWKIVQKVEGKKED